MPGTRVLLVGEGLGQHSSLARRLTIWGGDCHFATSYRDVQSLATQWVFALAIGEMKFAGGSLTRLVSLFEHYPTNMFCSYPIEDSCLWIPLLSNGRICLGAPLLRPAEFTRLLQRTLTNERLLSVSEEKGGDVVKEPQSPLSVGSSVRAHRFAKAG